MSTRPSLVRSIPFWALLAASIATAAAGALILTDRLGVMTKTLTDGTATGVEVYVGQALATLGAVLLGTGIIGILISLAVAALSTLRPHAPVEVVEPIDWSSEEAADDEIVTAEPEEPAADAVGTAATADATEADRQEDSSPTR